jgi:NAD(P)H-dependent flavin oxidoreductase YrpB (nitropropane dioxygenase family)
MVRTALCDRLGIEYPIVGFTPSEHVAAAISRAGGLGVLGCVRFNEAAELDAVLHWMDANTGGKPYGVDIVMPAAAPAEGTPTDLEALIPAAHKDFVQRTLTRLGVPPLATGAETHAGVLGWLHSIARSHVDVALSHRISLIANALGSPPADVIDRAHERGVPVAALAGKAEHAARHVDNGVDIVVAQGYEAGGHTGEVATMVLVPEIVDAVSVPVLAAGGIGSGRQVVAALALGAVGVWMGSYWLTTAEYRQTMGESALQSALLAASSSDTVRSRIYSGKPARLLRTQWTDAWAAPGAPEPLPMPLQNILLGEAHQRLMRSGNPAVVAMPVGQIVGRMNEVLPVADVFDHLLGEVATALSGLDRIRVDDDLLPAQPRGPVQDVGEAAPAVGEHLAGDHLRQ